MKDRVKNKDKLVYSEDTNPLYNIYNENQKLLYRYSNYSLKAHEDLKGLVYSEDSDYQLVAPRDLKKLLTRFDNIFTSTRLKELYFWFLDNFAATGSHLKDHHGYDNNVYKYLNDLEKNGLIVPYMKIRAKKTGGQKPVLYGLPDLPPETVARKTYEIQLRNKKVFNIIDKLVQRTLLDIKNEEIQFSKIMHLTRVNATGYHYYDLAELVAHELQEKHNVKVWRNT